MKPIGVLCLQGDFREHLLTFKALGIPTVRVRKEEGLIGIGGLVIPGGESTVIDKLSKIFGLRDSIIKLISQGLPTFGTCAGLILLAEKLVDGTQTQQTFGGLNVVVQRNAFGSQLDSFEEDVDFVGIDTPVHAAFIRAPIVTEIGADVSVVAKLEDGRIVGVQQGNILGISFHPEVTGETAVHRYFADMCKSANF
ncbi:MAG: pyridoxal 5'-phosphate synthase glutaminase subunit PdxT [Rhodoluna sp.]|nr:pyridoxal 5'-phosphate synthase glutaminase subunit PdxT [Rhodoluna sp.]